MSCALLMLLSAYIHVVGNKLYFPVSKNIIIFFMYVVALLIWIKQVNRRVISISIRKYLSGSGIFMLIWMTIRTFKYVYVPAHHIIGRHCWYLYYFCMLNTMCFAFIAVLHIGKKEGESIDGKWKFFYFFVTLALSLAVFTNDFHQKAFFFNSGLSGNYDHDVGYGIVYFAAMFYMLFLFLASIFVTFVRCSVADKIRYIWIPMIPIFFGALYCIEYITATNRNSIFFSALMPAEVGCFIMAAFLECLILIRLLPSNDSYEDFWKLSSLCAGIMDNDGKIRYETGSKIAVTRDMLEEAGKGNFFIDENTLLNSKFIGGCISYWVKDISKLNRLNEELRNTGDVIAEENAIMDAENKMREENIKVQQQSKLYDEIARILKPKLDKLDGLLSNPYDDEDSFRENMKYACVLNAYIKRFSNLLILSASLKQISSEELRLSFAESFEYINLMGIETHMDWKLNEYLSIERALILYEFFESVMDSSMIRMKALLAEISSGKAEINLNMQIVNPKEVLTYEKIEKYLRYYGCKVEIDFDDEENTEYIALSIKRDIAG